MSETITTTSSSSSSYSGMTQSDLADAIRKESSKARTKGNEMIDCMERIGHLLIELKTRVDHGNFMDQAERMTGLPQRSINRYMAIARDPDGFRNRRRGIPAEELMTMTKKAPTWSDRIEQEAKVDTVSISSAVEPPSPPPSRSTVIEVEAEIVEPAAPATSPGETRGTTSSRVSTYTPSDGLAISATAKGVLGRIHAKDTEREEALHAVIRYCQDKLPAPAVAAPTASPAPSLIETSETTLAEILGLLQRLRPAEIAELHRVIESRWMKPQTQTAAP